jgi:hypothetical protein
LANCVKKETFMTKKVVIGMVLAFGAILAFTFNASAASQATKSTKTGPYEGTFKGTVYGDKGTSAPLTLVLNHRGNDVEGKAILGDGLYLDGGMCGAGYVPASQQSATVEAADKDPRHLAVQTIFEVSGINIKIDLNSQISADGEELEAEAKIDLPWLCGHDPVISGTLNKAA